MSGIPDKLLHDPDGMATYEYLVNNIDMTPDALSYVIEIMNRVDTSGQFLASSARFLAAIDREEYASAIDKLVNLTIEKDKEHNFLPSLLHSIWGEDYADHIEELRATDDNFRRIYKRLYPTGSM